MRLFIPHAADDAERGQQLLELHRKAPDAKIHKDGFTLRGEWFCAVKEPTP